jgi:hypothetical protein
LLTFHVFKNQNTLLAECTNQIFESKVDDVGRLATFQQQRLFRILNQLGSTLLQGALGTLSLCLSVSVID